MPESNHQELFRRGSAFKLAKIYDKWDKEWTALGNENMAFLQQLEDERGRGGDEDLLLQKAQEWEKEYKEREASLLRRSEIITKRIDNRQ